MSDVEKERGEEVEKKIAEYVGQIVGVCVPKDDEHGFSKKDDFVGKTKERLTKIIVGDVLECLENGQFPYEFVYDYNKEENAIRRIVKRNIMCVGLLKYLDVREANFDSEYREIEQTAKEKLSDLAGSSSSNISSEGVLLDQSRADITDYEILAAGAKEVLEKASPIISSEYDKRYGVYNSTVEHNRELAEDLKKMLEGFSPSSSEGVVGESE